MNRSLSVIIPAFNEAKNIRAACLEVARAVEKHIPDYEILVIDDASQDETSEVVRDLQGENPRILLFRNPFNRGLGYNYRFGISRARCTYSIMVPGDNEVVAESLIGAFQQIGTADIVVCYASNAESRPFWRRAVSQAFTRLLNLLFHLKIRYYNGPSIIQTSLAKEFVSSTSGFAYMAVLLVQLIKAGASYQQVAFSLRSRQYGKTKAFRLKNILSVIKNIVVLFYKVYTQRPPKLTMGAGLQSELQQQKLNY